MYTIAFLIGFVLSVVCADLPECHPDYDEWLSVGAPVSWTYPRQCHGDTDNLKSGSALGGYFYVTGDDLSTALSTWTVKEPPQGPGIFSVPNGLGADFDHRKSGSPYIGYHRVGTNDFCILLTYFGKKEPPVGPGVPQCDFTCPIDPNPLRPQLSLRVKTQSSFEDRDIINVYPGTLLDVGIVNSTTEAPTLAGVYTIPMFAYYDGYVAVSGNSGYGTWTGTSWVCQPAYFHWNYFGTSPVAGKDTWYVETVDIGVSAPKPTGVTTSVQYLYNGGGDVTIELYNEYYELADTLTIQGPVTVLSPNGGEVLIAGQSFDIAWNSAAEITSVNIEYSLDNGGVWNSIAEGIANTGHYTWEPIPVADANECLLRISDSLNSAINDVSDTAFTIFTCAIAPITADLNNDCYVNLEDFAIFCQSWLVCGNPFDPICDP